MNEIDTLESLLVRPQYNIAGHYLTEKFKPIGLGLIMLY
jgi:hypothetical protein